MCVCVVHPDRCSPRLLYPDIGCTSSYRTDSFRSETIQKQEQALIVDYYSLVRTVMIASRAMLNLVASRIAVLAGRPRPILTSTSDYVAEMLVEPEY